MTFSITEVRERRIGSLVITKELYDKLEKYSRSNGLITSTYNHGHGVVRYYTVKYCLQMNYHGQNHPQKYLIKRGGRYPSKYAMVKKTVEELGNDSNLLIVFYVQIMPDDFVMQLHRF